MSTSILRRSSFALAFIGFSLSFLVEQAAARQAYAAVVPVQPSDIPGKVEVLEFFSYTCGPCATMEPLIERWARTAPPDVVLKRVPVAFNAAMRPMQQVYYTFLAVGRPDLHAAFFDAIHRERMRLFDQKSMTDWAVSQGVDRAKFNATFDSFSVQVEVQRASQLTEAYRLIGTPSFAIGGKFMTSPAMAGNSYEGVIKEIDMLIPLARN